MTDEIKLITAERWREIEDETQIDPGLLGYRVSHDVAPRDEATEALQSAA